MSSNGIDLPQCRVPGVVLGTLLRLQMTALTDSGNGQPETIDVDDSWAWHSKLVWWILGSPVGYAAGYVSLSAVLRHRPSVASTPVLNDISFVIGLGVAGFAFGTVTALFVKTAWRSVEFLRWSAASVIGAIVGGQGALSALSLMPQIRFAGAPASFWLAWAVGGIGLGLPQWMSIREDTRHSKLWIAATSIAAGVIFLVVVLLLSLVQALAPPSD